MNVKDHVNNMKNSNAVQAVKALLRPTWKAIKEGKAYGILILSTILMAIFIPMSFFVTTMFKFLSVGLEDDFFKGFTFYTLIDYMKDGYFRRIGATLILGLIICLIIFIIKAIVAIFIVSNATVKSTKAFVEQGAPVSVGQYFKLSVNDLLKFSWGLFVNVFLPVIIVSIIGAIINLIPGIKGSVAAALVNSFLYYGLLFRYIAIVLNIDGDSAVQLKAKYWLAFALVIYLVTSFTSFAIVKDILDISFMMFSVLVLTKNPYYTGEELRDNVNS